MQADLPGKLSDPPTNSLERPHSCSSQLILLARSQFSNLSLYLCSWKARFLHCLHKTWRALSRCQHLQSYCVHMPSAVTSLPWIRGSAHAQIGQTLGCSNCIFSLRWEGSRWAAKQAPRWIPPRKTFLVPLSDLSAPQFQCQ